MAEIMQRLGSEIPYLYTKTLLTFLLLIPTFISIQLLRERGEKLFPWILAVIPALFFILTPKSFYVSTNFRFAQLFVATHVFAAIAPYLRGNNSGEIWEFNKTMFLRFILSTIYSSVLVGGLFVCMGALQGLFLMDLKGNDYITVFYICAFVFHPMHFLAGVPKDLSRTPEYPRALQIFCQNLFIPLIGILGTILVVYAVTIAVNMSWPRGLVSLLISTFSSLGILSILLVDPLIRARTGWFWKYERYFYVVMTALSVVMMAAAWRRISEYALTEERYFVMLIAVWLFAMGSLFIVKPARSIKIIPVSLFVVTLLTAYGPWSAPSVSLRSQKRRLQTLLEMHHVLIRGKLTANSRNLSQKQQDEVYNIVSYIDRYHGMQTVSSWMKSTDLSSFRFYEEAGLQSRSWDYTNYWSVQGTTTSEPIDIQGYRKMYNFNLTNPQNYMGVMELKSNEFIVTVNGFTKVIPINAFVKDNITMQTHETKDMIFEGGSGNTKWKLIIQNASGYLGDKVENRRITTVAGILLY